jgi:hypothetical protein
MGALFKPGNHRGSLISQASHIAEGDDVVGIEPDADAFADRVIVVRGHERQHFGAARQAQRVEELGAAEGAMQDLGLQSGCRSSCTMSSGRSRTSTRQPRPHSAQVSCIRAAGGIQPAQFDVDAVTRSRCRAGKRPGRRNRRRSDWPAGGRGCTAYPTAGSCRRP